MSRTHVWLLHRGSPSEPSELLLTLRALASEPARLPGWLGWLGWLGAWLWVSWWSRRLLPGPTPASELADSQARKLGALLGEPYAVRVVHGEADLEQAASHLGRDQRVVLVSMTPHGGARATRLSEAAFAAATRREARPVRAPDLGTLPAYQETVAETTRLAISELPRGTSYEVVYAGMELTGRGASSDALRALAAELPARTGLHRPAHLGFLPGPGALGGHPALREILRALPAGQVIVVPLNSLLGADLELRPLRALRDRLAREAPGLTLSFAPPPGDRPTLIRGIAEHIWQIRGPAV